MTYSVNFPKTIVRYTTNAGDYSTFEEARLALINKLDVEIAKFDPAKPDIDTIQRNHLKQIKAKLESCKSEDDLVVDAKTMGLPDVPRKKDDGFKVF